MPNPFSAAAGGTDPGQRYTTPRRLPAPAPARRQKDRFSRPIGPEQAVQNRSIGTLAGRAQARYRLVNVQCAKSGQSVDLFRYFVKDREAPEIMQLALYQPDIPQNTGTILRLCACLDVAAHIIEPAGFPVSDRHFRRAGMEYLDRVTLTRHVCWDAFTQWRRASGLRLVLMTTRATRSYLDHRFTRDDIVL